MSKIPGRRKDFHRENVLICIRRSPKTNGKTSNKNAETPNDLLMNKLAIFAPLSPLQFFTGPP